MISPLKAIRRNAERLLSDALVLYDLKRWASATALAVLAVEEMGKYFLIKWEKSDTRALSSHKAKQGILASFLIVRAISRAENAWMTERGLERKHWSELNPDIQAYLESPEGQKWRKKIDEEWEKIAVEGIIADEHRDIGVRINRGEIDKIKQAAFYVDIDADGTVVSDPSNCSQEIADEWIGHARYLIERKG